MTRNGSAIISFVIPEGEVKNFRMIASHGDSPTFRIKNNPEITADKVEICPNCIDVQDMNFDEQERIEMRDKYGIPQNKKVFVYGGNLGKPQGIAFVIECLKLQERNQNAFFLIVGDGTDYGKLEEYFKEAKPSNMKLMKQLPKDDYDRMITACDVGLIFLDHRFTIPNFPSRLLSYMQAGLPVLACTDPNTDIGKPTACQDDRGYDKVTFGIILHGSSHFVIEF